MNIEVLLGDGLSPAQRAARVQESMISITPPPIKGAHDAQMVVAGDRAYVVYEANDRMAGENGSWPFIYSALSIVNLRTNALEQVVNFAQSEQRFANEALPAGCCFVPRIARKDERTLRAFFSSQDPASRPAQMYYIDFDLASGSFANHIHRLMLRTDEGVRPCTPQVFHAQAARQGFGRPVTNEGVFLFQLYDIEGRLYVALNNYGGRQNALGAFDEALETVEVIGNINEPQSADLCEAAIQKMPDGRWLAILRDDGGSQNYRFAESQDGARWSAAEERPLVTNGSNSKPILERFGGLYFLGWQEKPARTRFNIDVSEDGRHWTRAFEFHAPQGSFQYPSLCEDKNRIYLCATIGKKEQIVFGRLL